MAKPVAVMPLHHAVRLCCLRFLCGAIERKMPIRHLLDGFYVAFFYSEFMDEAQRFFGAGSSRPMNGTIGALETNTLLANLGAAQYGTSMRGRCVGAERHLCCFMRCGLTN
jgi:hypothetical protein